MEYGIYAGFVVLLLGAIALLAWGTRPSSREERVRMALEHLDSSDPRSIRAAELSEPAGERLVKPTFRKMARMAKLITPVGRVRTLETKVERAGRPWGLDVNGLLAVKMMSLAAGLVILVVLVALHVLPLIWFIVLAVVVVALSYYLPDLILHFTINTRKRQIARALPDFLDLLTVTVEAGLGLDSALAKISEKMRDPLREEILITLHHIRMGESREVALKAFAQRCEVEDLSNFVSALIQSQRLGVSLGTVLRVQSETIRTSQRQRIEEGAQKAVVKILMPLVLCIFPVMFFVIVGPAAIKIYHALLG